MKTPLANYMKSEGISDAEFALRIGRDRSLVNKLRRGIVRPTLDLAAVIETQTGGEIPMQAWAPAEARAA